MRIFDGVRDACLEDVIDVYVEHLFEVWFFIKIFVWRCQLECIFIGYI